MNGIDLPVIDGWSPGVGDPTLLGWATTGVYLLAAWLCARAFAATMTGHRVGTVRVRRFWSLLAVAMAALAINKQLDLQMLLTVLGRRMAHDEGWYEARRAVQRAFIIAVALTGGVVLGLMLRHLRRATHHARVAGMGLAFLVAFIVIRAASFHHMGAAIHAGWAGISIDHLLELGGIALIAVGAAGDRRRQMAVATCRQL